MVDPITARTSRTPLIGVAVALTAGLALGGSLRPDLIGDAGLIGPQVMVGSAGVRRTPASDLAFMSFSGPLPDYVLGTDTLRPQAVDATPAGDETERLEDAPSYPEASPDYAQAVYELDEEAPAPAPSYPSTDGGLPYGSEAPAPSMGPMAIDLAREVVAG